MKTPTLYYIFLLAVVIAGVHSQFTPEGPDAQVTQCVLNEGIPEVCATEDINTLCFNFDCRVQETVFEACGYALAPGKVIAWLFYCSMYLFTSE